jgi:hypothetical protein
LKLLFHKKMESNNCGAFVCANLGSFGKNSIFYAIPLRLKVATHFTVAAGVLACRRAVASRPAECKPPRETKHPTEKDLSHWRKGSRFFRLSEHIRTQANTSEHNRIIPPGMAG